MGHKIGRLEKAAVAISKSQCWTGFGQIRSGRVGGWVGIKRGRIDVGQGREGLMGESAENGRVASVAVGFGPQW
jgi:hypothetical protein